MLLIRWRDTAINGAISCALKSIRARQHTLCSCSVSGVEMLLSLHTNSGIFSHISLSKSIHCCLLAILSFADISRNTAIIRLCAAFLSLLPIGLYSRFRIQIIYLSILSYCFPARYDRFATIPYPS